MERLDSLCRLFDEQSGRHRFEDDDDLRFGRPRPEFGKYQANLANLPSTNLEMVIAGGNHGGFGNYGTQKGDGEAGISPETQQALAAQALLHFVS